MLENIHIEQIIKKVFRVLRWAGENMFLSFLVFLLIALLFSSAVFYKYVFSLSEVEVEPQSSESNFKNGTFQKIIGIWDERARAFQEAEPSAHRDIFSPNSVIVEEELTEE